MNIMTTIFGGGVLTVKWHVGIMQHQGIGRGKRVSQGKRGEGRVHHDTTPSTKGVTRMKVRQAEPAYWA